MATMFEVTPAGEDKSSAGSAVAKVASDPTTLAKVIMGLPVEAAGLPHHKTSTADYTLPEDAEAFLALITSWSTP